VPPEIKPKTPLSLAICTGMKQVPLSSKQLKVEVDVSYETIRSILKGDRPPSKRLLRDICRVLTLDFETMNDMLTTEHIKEKFGRVPALRKSDPELQLIEEAWPFLLPEEKEHVTLLVEKYVGKRNPKQQAIKAVPRIGPRPIRTP